MKEQNNGLLIGIVVLCMTVLFVLNFTGFFHSAASQRYIAPVEVRGVAVEHDDKLYTLNFDQQNSVITLFNQSVRVGSEGIAEGDLPDLGYEKIHIYRFGKSNIVITPLALVNRQLLFRAPEWNPDGLLRETGPGELNSLLSQTYDH